MSDIFPAATVVLVRDGARGLETLLLRRSRKVSFAKGLWVFPGGRIDRADYLGDAGDIESAARRGAVRETLEETGLHIDARELVYFAHWTTPPQNPRRYATWFFVTGVGADSDAVTVDGSEILEHRWCRPQEALADHRSGTIEMLPPTLSSLNAIAQCDAVEQVVSSFRERPVNTFAPQFSVTERGVTMRQQCGDDDSCALLWEGWRGEQES